MAWRSQATSGTWLPPGLEGWLLSHASRLPGSKSAGDKSHWPISQRLEAVAPKCRDAACWCWTLAPRGRSSTCPDRLRAGGYRLLSDSEEVAMDSEEVAM